LRRELDPVLVPIPLVRRSPPWVRLRKRLFTGKQCEKMLQYANEKGRYYRSGGKALERAVYIRYIYPDDARWAYEKLARAFAEENVWGFALAGIAEPLRIQKYRVGGYTATHTDVDFGAAVHAKITAIVPLVRRASWSGGGLTVGDNGRTPSLDKGDCLFFPSFAPHSVSRVSRGERVVLSAWVAGPPLY